MPGDFRIVRAMHKERIDRSCTRYGFIIPHHPQPNFSGGTIGSWATYEDAEISAIALGLHPSVVTEVKVTVTEIGHG